MGYIIKSSDLLSEEIEVSSLDFGNCATVPIILIKGDNKSFFQLISVVATCTGSNFTASTPYVIKTTSLNREIASTNQLSFSATNCACTYQIANDTINNAQRNGINNDLIATMRTPINPSGFGLITFYITYKKFNFK
jgi:hypothetical protein